MANPIQSQKALNNEWVCPAGHTWKAAKPRPCAICGGAPLPNEASDPFVTVASPRVKRPRLPLPDPLPAVPGYEVMEELGRGGMGIVYLARQKGLNRLVALKMLLPGAREARRFKTEAEAVARLQHPGIVQVFEVNEWRPSETAQPLPFFTMEYCPGGNLDRAMKDNPLSPREAATVVAKLARAVQHAHDHGIVHRDLKPANILLASERVLAPEHTQGGTDGPRGGSAEATILSLESAQPKVADFGLARKLDEQGQTQTGDVMGTPAFMAPEQASGKKVGPEADIWALGGILYECLTGRPPFKGPTAMDTMFLVLNEEPVPPRRLNPRAPADLETIALKCLNKDAARRYVSAGALANDLEHYLAGLPILARPLGPFDRAWRWAWRYPLVASLLAAVIFLLLAVAVSTSILAFTLAQSRDAFRRTVDRIEEQVTWMREDVSLWKVEVDSARARLATATASREKLEKQLKAVDAELAREWGNPPGPQHAARVSSLKVHSDRLRHEWRMTSHHEEKTRHHLEKVARDLEYREHRLHDLEEILHPRDGLPMPPPRAGKR